MKAPKMLSASTLIEKPSYYSIATFKLYGAADRRQPIITMMSSDSCLIFPANKFQDGITVIRQKKIDTDICIHMESNILKMSVAAYHEEGLT